MTSTHSSHSSTPHSSSGGNTNTLSNPSISTKSHSVSIGSSFRTSFPDDTEGSALKILTLAANDVRRSMHSPTNTSDVATPSSWSGISNILSAGSGTSVPAKYQWGSQRINAHGNTLNGHSSHTNTSESNDSIKKPTALIAHCNSKAGSYSLLSPVPTAAVQGTPVSQTTLSENAQTSYSTTNRDKILEDINGKMVHRSTIPSFGSWTGTYTNHMNHSSHANHSNT